MKITKNLYYENLTLYGIIVYMVIFEGYKFCGFCNKLSLREILIREKDNIDENLTVSRK